MIAYRKHGNGRGRAWVSGLFLTCVFSRLFGGRMRKGQSVPNLPQPTPAKAGSPKLIVITLVVLALLGGAVFWLTRDDETKAALKDTMLGAVENAVKDTPLAAVTNYLTPPPPPPPPSVTSPATQPGTLAGQVIQGTVPSGVDSSAPEGEVTEQAPPVQPKVEEDSAVRLLFIEDMAHWLVSRYQPGKGILWGVSGINMRYGTQLHGLNYQGADTTAGRAWLLRYVFNPAMLSALYNLYADRFVEELGNAAAEPRRGQPFTPEQTDAMFQAYAGRFAAFGGALQGIASITDFPARMAGVAKLSQQAVGIHMQIAEAVFALDEAREANSQSRMETAQLRINGLNAQYQKIMGERNMAQQALLTAIRRGGPAARELDDDTLMFVASWMERRLAHDPGAAQSATTAAGLLDNLAGRLRKAASIAR